MDKKSGLVSLLIHAALMLALLLISSIPRMQVPPRDSARIATTHLYLPRDLRRPAGGGSRAPLPATRGIAPKRIAKQFVAPVIAPRATPPLLAMAPALEAPPDMKLPDVEARQYGDPFAAYGPPSGGPGGPLGAGGSGCCGIGPGSGSNIGGAGERGHRGRMSRPKLLYMVEPEYSEEARKSRFQGTVVLRIVVDTGGRATEVHVVHGLGLGLDEKAIQAVGLWRFEPARQDGKPIPASAIVQVTFHLL